MKRTLLCALTAVAVSVSSFALTAAVAAGDQSAEAANKERMQHWAADHEAMMDAGLGGMKAALKLTPGLRLPKYLRRLERAILADQATLVPGLGNPPVDGCQQRAGAADIAGHIGCQKQDRLGDLVWIARTSQRHHRGHQVPESEILHILLHLIRHP